MLIDKYDVIIIGAGPAGIVAGIELIKNGFSVCILEKCVLPRRKLCGGLITTKTVHLLKKNSIDFEIVKSINKIQINKIKSVKVNKPLFFIDRFEFDNELLKQFKGKVIDNFKILNIDFSKNLIHSRDGDHFRYTYLIGADGALSTLIGKNLTLCTEETKQSYDSNIIRLNISKVECGYHWNFPTCIGEGYLNNTKAKYSQGAWIPYGKPVSNPTNNKNVLLVGDAAGLVNPITGEGIYYAILSGLLVAKAVQAGKSVTFKYRLSLLPTLVNLNILARLQKTIFKNIGILDKYPQIIKYFNDFYLSK